VDPLFLNILKFSYIHHLHVQGSRTLRQVLAAWPAAAGPLPLARCRWPAAAGPLPLARCRWSAAAGPLSPNIVYVRSSNEIQPTAEFQKPNFRPEGQSFHFNFFFFFF